MTTTLMLLLQKHPGIFNWNEFNILLEVRHGTEHSLQRKDALSTNETHQTYL